ncbi:MAG: hypothetical protein LBU88_03750 [Treponema sp.]|jgi:hypothetical protein|nr:hypothetical protein [Treponema sp.]
MLRKLMVLAAMLLIAGILLTGCRRSGSFYSEQEEEDRWRNPEFVMEDVVEIGAEWFLDLTALAPESWSDNDIWSYNPTKEVAEVTVNPNGGYDFTFEKFNQRIVLILDSSQRFSLWEATYVEVEIDGEATRDDVGFRYHIGWSEKGSNWNASISFEPAAFSSILNETLDITGEPEEREEKIVNFMIQTRGGLINDKFGDPVTVTIRSIKFKVFYD